MLTYKRRINQFRQTITYLHQLDVQALEKTESMKDFDAGVDLVMRALEGLRFRFIFNEEKRVKDLVEKALRESSDDRRLNEVFRIAVTCGVEAALGRSKYNGL